MKSYNVSRTADSEARRAEPSDPVGIVLQVQRMSTEDGPGLRSTAFLKGCPLSCAWCHNPESLRRAPEIQWIGSRCIAGSDSSSCGACVAACPARALSRNASMALVIDREACRKASGGAASCGFPCAAACPGGAVERLGSEMRASELAAELLKDSSYFAASERGGITLSGGEASAQAPFAREVMRRAKEAGVHTALDSCGFAAWETLASLYPYTDILLWDLKEADPGRHLEWTGAPLAPILENLRRTAALMRSDGDTISHNASPGAIWIRTPVIPGATAREENLEALGRIIAQIGVPRLERWELCAFNNLCADKYRRLDIEWRFAKSPLMEAEAMDALAAAAERGLGRKGIVSWTGSTRMPEQRRN